MKKYFIQYNDAFIKGIIIIFVLISIFIIKEYISRDSEPKFEYIEEVNLGDKMELVFFGLDEADSSLIRYKDQVILIDTGELEQGEYIVKNLLNLGIDKIDYLILTHPDKDHIGGAVEIIRAFDVGTIIQSSLEKGSDLQKKLNNEINKKKIATIILEKDYQINMQEVNIKIFAAKEKDYKKSNNYSLMTLLTYGEVTCFFAGDAEKKRLEEALTYDLPEVTLYKVPHHGKYNKKSEEMIEKLAPEIAVVTSPNAEKDVLRALLIKNTKVYYASDEHLRFISDGMNIIKK